MNYFAVEIEFYGCAAKRASLPKIGKVFKCLARVSMMEGEYNLQKVFGVKAQTLSIMTSCYSGNVHG